jgi:methionyl-tRNA formyltransferase
MHYAVMPGQKRDKHLRPSLRVVFAGTPQFAVPSLVALLDDPACEVVAALTQPDRKAGRGQKTRFGDVKNVAIQRSLPLLQPATLRDDALRKRLKDLDIDIAVIVAYGLVVPPEVLEIPRRGFLNVHASLLPRWRGAAPIQRAILAGDPETGITIMQMTAGLDRGPILMQRKCAITAHDTAGQLHARLATIGAELLIQTLHRYAAGQLVPALQDEERVTYAPKIDVRETELDWSRPAMELDRMVRAFNPRPGARGKIAGIDLKIWEAAPIHGRGDASPGTLIATSRDGVDVATGDGVIRILRLQLPGRKPVSASDFLHANPHIEALAAR